MNSTFIREACGGDAEKKLFDGFTIIAAPLPGYDNAGREARVFKRKGGNGTDYGSHIMALAVPDMTGTYEGGRQLYILVSHGGGRELWAIPSFYDGGNFERALLAMPERLQYAALYTLYHMASDARIQAQEETSRKYAKAFVEKRLKTKRRNNRKYVEIMPEVAAL